MINYYPVVVEHQRDIMRAFLAGERIEAVAQKYRMSRTSLHRHLTRLGYTVPDGRRYKRKGSIEAAADGLELAGSVCWHCKRTIAPGATVCAHCRNVLIG